MAEFEELSSELQLFFLSYVDRHYENYLSAEDRSEMHFPTYDEFVVSLYAETPGADSRVLQELSEYRVDLTGMLSPSTMEEFGAIIRYCSRYDYRLWPSKRFSCMVRSELIEFCLSLVRDYCGAVVKGESHRIFKTSWDSGFQRIPSSSGSYRTEAPKELSESGLDLFPNRDTYSTPESVFKSDVCGDVLFPFADDIQFAQALSGCSFDVYEPDSKFWAFGQILKEAYSRDVKIQLGSASENADGKLYDYVFSCPVLRKDVRSVAEELYKVAATRLKDNGIMCCLLPENFCYAPEWLGLRKILIDKAGQYSALIISLPDFLQPYVVGNICVFCLLKPNRDEILNSYRGIIDEDEVKIKEGNWVTDDVGRVEKWLDRKINKVVWVNAKKDDFFGGYRLYDEEKRFPPSSNEEDNTWHPNFQVVLDAISALADSTFAKVNEIMVSSPVDSRNVGDNVNILPSSFLLYGKLFPSMSPDENYERLEEVVDLLDLSAHPSSDNDGEIRCLDPSDLFTDYLNCDISCKKEQKTTKRSLKGYSKTARTPFSIELPRVTEKCILVSYSDGKLRVGRIVDPSCQYELSPEIIAFRVKGEEVSEGFLLRSLLSENAKEQMRMLSWGRFYSSIDPKDFLQIIIPVPSKEEQERICKEEVQERLKETDQELKQAKEKIESDFKKYVEDIHLQKHAIGQTIFDLNNWWTVLQLAREKNGGNLNDDTVVGNSVKTKVSEIYDDLSSIISRLQQQIAKMDRGNGLSAEVFPLTEVIEDFIKKHPNALFEYEYDVENHYKTEETIHIKRGKENSKDEEKKVLERKPKSEEYVKFPRKAFTMVLEDIVNNACSHGFVDSSEGNKIRIDFGWVGGYVVATVSNNGKPMSKDMESRVFQYGESSKNDGENSKNGEEHFGLGGYEIKHLMWEFGGDVEISSAPPEGYTVSYQLTFPLADEPVEVANSQSARDLPENVSEN